MIDLQGAPLAPKAQKIPRTLSIHGDTRIDNYFWMKERDSADVLAHLNSENSYYEAMTANSSELRSKIFEEIKARVKPNDSTAPFKNGPYFYSTEYRSGLEYPIFKRSETPSAPSLAILDVNQLAQGQKYTSVTSPSPSPNHELIVYGCDFVGRRFYDLHFKNLKTGETLPLSIPRTTGNVVWAEDGKTLFYSLQNPSTLRFERVMKFDLETAVSTEVYFEPDEVFSVRVSKSQNDDYIFITSSSFDSTEIQFINSKKPNDPWQTFLKREGKHEYGIDFGDGEFYVLSNWQAENFRLMKVPFKDSHGSLREKRFDKDSWQEVVPHRSDVYISDFLLLKNHIALSLRHEGLTKIEVLGRKTESSTIRKMISFPDASYVVNLGSNLEYDTDRVRLSYQSLTKPNTTHDYFLNQDRLDAIKVSEVPTYDESLYASERVWATASDGAKIPISLVYRKDRKRGDGKNPTLIYGYGSYGFSVDPGFRISVVSLLDRGFIYAIAHVRGGSEMGRAWYEQGRMEHKKNTFSDFVTVTEHLIATHADHENVFASGGSAGGLLMGAIVNLRPDLYKGIVSSVPFVDVVTTMLDSDIPLTTSEYEQWGNPNSEDAYHYMKSYSPYDNIERKPYPAMLVVTGYHDSQVQYWEPAKYVAKVRELTTSKIPVLFKIDMDAGHSGASGRFQALKDVAHELAFIVTTQTAKTKDSP